jgi:hypothetical protein
VAFGTNCRSAPVPFIFLRHYCTQMRVDLFCFLDAAKFFLDDNRARPFIQSRFDLGERWPSRLVATAAEKSLNCSSQL